MSVNKPDGGSVRVKTLRPGDHLGYDAIFSEVRLGGDLDELVS